MSRKYFSLDRKAGKFPRHPAPLSRWKTLV
jgi:hypothetical protein